MLQNILPNDLVHGFESQAHHLSLFHLMSKFVPYLATRPIMSSFVYFRPFLITISIIQIEKSVDGVLGIWACSSRMVGADKTTELCRPPCNGLFNLLKIFRERDIMKGDYECLETLNEIMNSFDKVRQIVMTMDQHSDSHFKHNQLDQL